MATLTLANICLDVQIGICIFLHPSDILALRKTCKAFERTTRRRVVWVAALHRVCVDNALFLPSFPISDMSDLELEKAALGPRRWIELCGAFEKQHLNDPGAILRPRATRIINDSFTTEVDYETTEFFIAPGGRYLVSYSPDNISVLDLGYTSSADCKLIDSVGLEGVYETCIVQATSDGMGLIIFSSDDFNCSVYEIYPKSETPHLTQVAHLDFEPPEDFEPPGDFGALLLPGTVIWNGFCDDMMVFKVWDYRLNHSISFYVDVQVDISALDLKVTATKTAVIVLYEDGVLIWAIPPLSSEPPDFFYNHYPTHALPPLFEIPFPDSIASYTLKWITISSWYFGSSHPLYFDMLHQDSNSKFHRIQFMLNLKSDLSTGSLNIINTSELTPHSFDDVIFQNYTICDDTLVSSWFCREHYHYGAYTRLMSAPSRSANVISHRGTVTNMSLPDIGHKYHIFSCPASGRFVLLDSNNRVSVLDFF